MDRNNDPYVIIAKIVEAAADILTSLSEVREGDYSDVDLSGKSNNINILIVLMNVFLKAPIS